MSEPTTRAAGELIAWLEGERRQWAAAADEDEQSTFVRLAAQSRRDQLDTVLGRLPGLLARVELDAVLDEMAEQERRMAALEAV